MQQFTPTERRIEAVFYYPNSKKIKRKKVIGWWLEPDELPQPVIWSNEDCIAETVSEDDTDFLGLEFDGEEKDWAWKAKRIEMEAQ